MRRSYKYSSIGPKWLWGLLIASVSFGCRNNVPEVIPTTSANRDQNLTIKVSEDALILPPDYDTLEWREMLSSNFDLDLRYATKDNFTKVQIYPCARCFLRPQLAEKLVQIQTLKLKPKGLNFKLFDCYRPAPAQQKLWDIVPDATYVANPAKGSMHNKGLAVDLTLVDDRGVELDMGTDFDFFGREARHSYTELADTILKNRKYLKALMETHGFNSIKSEWWHYSLNGTGHKQSSWEWLCNN